jgi:hypothetical protein
MYIYILLQPLKQCLLIRINNGIQSGALPYTIKLFMKTVDRSANIIILTVGISFLLREYIFLLLSEVHSSECYLLYWFYKYLFVGASKSLVAGHYCFPRGCVYFE